MSAAGHAYVAGGRAHFQRFGEIYFSAVHPGAVKAWHMHRKMVLNYVFL